MKKTLLLLSAAAAFTVASCNQDKPAETTTTETTTVTTTTPEDDMAYRERANRIADKMAADLKITDTATVSKIRTTYYNRARRLGEVRTKYTTDTTGMAADMRSAYSEADTEFQGYLPAESYTVYETSRPTYYEEAYMDNTMSADASTPESRMEDAAAGIEPGSKVKGEDGSKIKVAKDGDVKVKDAEGNKAKVDGDDGTVKLKPEDAKKVKIK